MRMARALMRASTLALPLAMVIGPAHALADGERLYFEVSNDLSPSQPTAVVTLWTEFDPADYCFGATLTEVRATDGLWSDPRRDPGMTGLGTSPGVVSPDGLRVLGVLPGQFHFPYHSYGDPSNPIEIWRAEITVTDFTPREVALSTATERYMVHPFAMSPLGRDVLDVTEAAATIAVVPAPGVASVVVVGLAIVRGRRRT